MKPAKVLACCLLILPLVGTALSSVPRPRAKSLPLSQERLARRAPLETLKTQAIDLFRRARYSEAEILFQRILQSALSLQEFDLAGRAAANAGACQFAHRRYQQAVATFLQARRLAERAGDISETAIIDANLGSLYSEMGDLETAAQWTQRGLERLSGRDRQEHLHEVQISLALLRARQQRLGDSLELFRAGLQGADRRGDLAFYSLACNRLGEELLKANQPGPAEAALLEAYRIRKLHHLPLDTSYRSLGRLRLEQGDLRAASALLDQAVSLSQNPRGLMPSWDIFHYRGRTRLRQGRLREALDDLRVAVRLARAWRWSVPAEDVARIGSEGWLDTVHGALIEAGNRLYLQTRDAALLRETFEAVEENRASSLRALLRDRQAQMAVLPPSYWEATARLQRAEIAAVRDDPAAAAQVRASRAELAMMEAALGSPAQPQPGEVMADLRQALGSGTVLFSFQFGDTQSWVWAVDRAGADLYPLPPRAELENLIRETRAAILGDAPQAEGRSAALYQVLFGPIAASYRDQPYWLLSLDPSLIELPLAALVETPAPSLRYLVERHTTQVVPGAAYWVEWRGRSRTPNLAGLFVGVGDPIYNLADPRRGATPPVLRWTWPGQLRAGSLTGTLALPRLVGSGAELDACARAWPGSSVLLRGADATERKLSEQLDRKPAVVHLATHVLPATAAKLDTRLDFGLIALSLTPQGVPEMLSPSTIARAGRRAELVVLSGCESGGGAVLQGTGLMGLTRAWLAAGAHSVVASRWATPDEEGGLFGVFYRTLNTSHSGPADALRTAQVAMIRAGGWRARPRYWGTYFTMGSQ